MKLSTSIRSFVLVVSGVYFFVVAAVIGISALSNAPTIPQIGNRLLQVGIAVFVISWFILGSTVDNAKDMIRSPQIRNDSFFKQRRQQQRLFEMTFWAVIIAAALVALTGFVAIYAEKSGWFLAWSLL